MRNRIVRTRIVAGMIAAVAALAVMFATGCAPRESSLSQGGGNEGGDDTLQISWSVTSDCESCHTREAAAPADATSLHAVHASSSCLSCHDDEQGLAKAHEGYEEKDPASNLKKTDVADESCLASGCHDQTVLAEATAGETVLTDTKGTVVNPHDLPIHEDHAKGVRCASCHKMHGEGSIEADAVYQASKATCLSCHHNEVYECHTCHT